MTVIDFRTASYFHWTVMLVGAFLGITGLASVFTQPIMGVIFILISAITLTTHYRVKINLHDKVFHDYLWILGLKIGEKGKFEIIEYLFIKKSKVSQTMSVRVASTTIRKDVYDGYLKFSDNDKIHLMTKDSKNDMIEKLRKIAAALKVKIIDYSDGDPTEI